MVFQGVESRNKSYMVHSFFTRRFKRDKIRRVLQIPHRKVRDDERDLMGGEGSQRSVSEMRLCEGNSLWIIQTSQ